MSLLQPKCGIFDEPLHHLTRPEVLPVTIVPVTGRKRAVARLRGAGIELTMPRHWPTRFKHDVEAQLTHKLQAEFQRDWQLVSQATGPRITIADKTTLWETVQRINAETVHAGVKSVRMGTSRYSHLAQMNLKTHGMTVSRFSLQAVPESALRYLIIHELAHLFVPNHSRAFWNLVGLHVPNLNQQRRLMAATHRMRLYQAESRKPSVASPLSAARKPRLLPEKLIRTTQKTTAEGTSFLQQLLNLF